MEPAKDAPPVSYWVYSWIISLAISIACCAILFLIFANYLEDVHRDISIANVRIETLEHSVKQNMDAVEYLRHLGIVQANPAALGAGEALPQPEQSPATQPASQPPAPSPASAPPSPTAKPAAK